MAKAAKPAAKPAKATKTAKAPAVIKPIKETMTKSALVAYLAEHSAVELKSVKAVLASLEATILASVHKKGAGLFQLPGLLKITSQAIPAKPKRKGKNPFTGEEQVFAAKPATVKIKVRPLKKLKDAAV
jgi:nucleoid DNA-binding protein